MKDLNGRIVLVTGAARGIGKLQAMNFAREGCRVVITDIDLDELERVAAEMQNMGLDVRPYRLDVSSRQECMELAGRVDSEVGPVDILINNAAVVVCREVLELGESELRRMMDVNYFGQIWMMQAVVPSMIRRGGGHVVNMCSSAGKIGVARLGGYCATKFAMIGLTDSIRPELRKSGVKFTIVNPGYVKTGMFSGSRVPFFTRWIEPQEVADVVLKAVKKDRFEVCIPDFAVRLATFVRGLCIPRISDFINRVLGSHKSFLEWKKDPDRPF